MRHRRAALSGVASWLLLFGLLAFATPAWACSCARIDPAQGLADFPAAFVGTFIAKESSNDLQAVYTFEVEQWVKGDLGPTVEVRAPSQGSACGYEFAPGQRMASFLRVEDGIPTGGLCQTMDPDVLLRATEPMTFNGVGPPHLLVAGPFTTSAHLVLDADGGLLVPLGETPDGNAAGYFDYPRAFRPCPGGRLIVEEWAWRLDVRDLTTLEVVSTVDLHGFSDHIGLADVECRTEDASSILLLGDEWTGDRSVARVYEAVPAPTPLFEVPLAIGDLGPTVLVLQDQDELGADVWLIADDETGPLLLHRIDRGDANHAGIVAASEIPTGGTVAVLDIRYPSGAGTPRSNLTLYDTTGAELRHRTFEAEMGSLEWLDGGRLLLHHYTDTYGARISILDGATLESVAEVEEWRGSRTVADGDLLYGVWEGHLDRVDLNTGVVEQLTVFSSPVYGPLAVLPVGSSAPTPDTEPVPSTTLTVPPATTAPVTTTPVAAGDAGADSSPLPWIFLGLLLLLGAGATGSLIARRRQERRL
ncbi:MAG: hypothetical protein KJ956_07915 [Actinobacteria bacterium]|nr:hypothetical protein [Actinomycetota bacterium]